MTGSFKFERIGTPYDAMVPVAAMRMVPAFFGSLMMPTVYNLMVELGLSHYTGALAAFLMIFGGYSVLCACMVCFIHSCCTDTATCRSCSFPYFLMIFNVVSMCLYFTFTDNALLAQSRYILMEGILLFFGLFGLLCILKFRRFYSQPYSLPWFGCLILGAASLTACVW